MYTDREFLSLYMNIKLVITPYVCRRGIALGFLFVKSKQFIVRYYKM